MIENLLKLLAICALKCLNVLEIASLPHFYYLSYREVAKNQNDNKSKQDYQVEWYNIKTISLRRTFVAD